MNGDGKRTCPAWTPPGFVGRAFFGFLLWLAFLGHGASAATAAVLPEESLKAYRSTLAAFRIEYGGARELPEVPFFQFGMGLRTKYLFKPGRLINAATGKIVRSWDSTNSTIVPPEYSVVMITQSGSRIVLVEDDQGVWCEEAGSRHLLEGTAHPVRLPTFAEHRYGSILRVLHHEILMNVTAAGPVPNFYVYPKPWYRDGAMMALCLRATGNLDLIRDWVRGLKEPYDRNNAGETEADNLGQVLFLISCAADKSHPLVARVLEEAKRFQVRDANGLYLKGRSDFAEHPVYQTKWLKFGLAALGLEDPYSVPALPDSYSSLFWMDYRARHVRGTEATDRALYPYLGWATDHFQGTKLSPISSRDYPLTWEIRASQAAYVGMQTIDPIFTTQKTAAPHTWHAAEVFLYLLAATELTHSTDWFSDAKLGAFMHFLPSPADGPNQVERFDVKTLADQLSAMGAGYFILTLGQNSGWFNSPNAAYARRTGYAPGARCAKRDLPMELQRELTAKGIRLMLYLPCQVPNQDRRAQKAFGLAEGANDQPLDQAFAQKWAEVIQEWSDRYGDKVSGWWFDGAYQHIGFKEEIAGLYAAAVKHGNPSAIVTFNPGVKVVRWTKAEDYTAGELNEPLSALPSSRWLDGSQWHALTYLGHRWGARDTRFTDAQWIDWATKVVAKQGVITLDMGPNYESAKGPIGSLAEGQRQQFKAIKDALRRF